MRAPPVGCTPDPGGVQGTGNVKGTQGAHAGERTDAGPGVFIVPLALIGGLLVLGRLPRIQQSEPLAWSFWGAALLLLAWQAAIFLWKWGTPAPRLELSRPRAQHYVQSLCQLGVYAYWGWFWPPVYAYSPLLLGQLVFAYAFDLLLAWSRRQPYALGFGPFPIVFSTNLFLWFRDDWFALQFVLIAVGFLGKAFVRWRRDGRDVHIFNPSAFTLALFSLVLLVTGTTGLTWAQEINTTFSLGPSIYLALFLIGLVVMYFFAITPVTAAAAATLFAGSAIYYAVTGVPYFVDSEIPSAVFLGLHLLVVNSSNALQIEDAFAALVQDRVEALQVGVDPLFGNHINQLVALATRRKIPTIYAWREFTVAGGLMSYGSSIPDAFHQVGVYTGQILKGAKPADLPVQRPTKLRLVLNLKAAKAIGLNVPATVFARADEVIE